MRADLIVLFEPSFDDGSDLIDRDKPFGIENFSAQRGVSEASMRIVNTARVKRQVWRAG